VTARHVYVRGHGPTGRYEGNYSDRTLRAWADAIAGWRRQRRLVFVYFDNDQKSAAPADARRLMEMVKSIGADELRGRRGQTGQSISRRDARL
jgi:uncharacterized protein YecE (DUF72 family)